MRLVLEGPPGAGKGTQAQLLTRRLGIPKISTGEMLRNAVRDGGALGEEIRGYLDRAQLVPDDLMLRLVRERLAQPDLAPGYLLDGFPRTVPQARELESWLEEQGERLNAVVALRVEDEVIVRRVSQRRICAACQASYHLESCPPRQEGVCDLCGGALVQRDDDREEMIRERLRVYHHRTEPVAGFYRDRDLLVEIDGEQPVAEVTERILAALGRVPRAAGSAGAR